MPYFCHNIGCQDLQFLRQRDLDRHLANCASPESKDAVSASEESGDWLNEGGYEPAESSGSENDDDYYLPPPGPFDGVGELYQQPQYSSSDEDDASSSSDVAASQKSDSFHIVPAVAIRHHVHMVHMCRLDLVDDAT